MKNKMKAMMMCLMAMAVFFTATIPSFAYSYPEAYEEELVDIMDGGYLLKNRQMEGQSDITFYIGIQTEDRSILHNRGVFTFYYDNPEILYEDCMYVQYYPPEHDDIAEIPGMKVFPVRVGLINGDYYLGGGYLDSRYAYTYIFDEDLSFCGDTSINMMEKGTVHAEEEHLLRFVLCGSDTWIEENVEAFTNWAKEYSSGSSMLINNESSEASTSEETSQIEETTVEETIETVESTSAEVTVTQQETETPVEETTQKKNLPKPVIIGGIILILLILWRFARKRR